MDSHASFMASVGGLTDSGARLYRSGEVEEGWRKGYVCETADDDSQCTSGMHKCITAREDRTTRRHNEGISETSRSETAYHVKAEVSV